MIFSIGTIITNIISLLNLLTSLNLNKYKKQFEAINYGKKVDIGGYNMSVHIAGEQNDQTIVLLPAYGLIAPYIFYKSFTEPLSENFKVITVEPFGYGASDVIDKERTNENIVSELHTCLEKLGVNKFYLMGHSIGGIYSIAYANKYPDEVLGFIGIDNTPVNSEGMIEPFTLDYKTELTIRKIIARYHLWRFDSGKEKESFNKLFDPKYKYSEEDMKNFDIIFDYNNVSENVISEEEHFLENVLSVKNLSFKCPILMFVSSSNCQLQEWKPLHDAMITNPKNSEVIVLEGSHMLHIDQKDNIIKKVNEWIK